MYRTRWTVRFVRRRLELQPYPSGGLAVCPSSLEAGAACAAANGLPGGTACANDKLYHYSCVLGHFVLAIGTPCP
jgi:hypothetical protein